MTKGEKGGKHGEQRPQEQTKKRETEKKRHRVGQPREGGTPTKRREDETIQPRINLGTDRNRDNVAKH